MARSLATVLVLISACASSDMVILECDADLRPISRVAPELPSKLHNEFEGYAVVQFMVGTDGQVHGPSTESSEWRPIGLSRGEPEGYDEVILAAVSKWRYPPRAESCRATTTVRVAFEE